MLALAVGLASLQIAGDTIRIDVQAAFERAVEMSPAIVATDLRAQAATDRSEQAGAFPNPLLTFNAENIGQQEALTGFPGVEGTEGQVVLTTSLPFGPERAGRTGMARGVAREFAAEAERTRAAASLEILAAIGDVLRDQTLARSARAEDDALTRFAEVLALQAREGRSSAGDAARAELSRGVAATRLARREASLGASMADLARRLGYSPVAWVSLDAPNCGDRAPIEPLAAAPSTLAEVAAASARLDQAEASVTLSQGLRLPDLLPQVGVRRAAGLNALYLGLSTTLPAFDWGGRAVSAAQAGERVAATELAAVQAQLDADAVSASRSLAALEVAGLVFREAWFEALELALSSAQVRYELGEGTLLEFLDSRRARLQALDDYAVWQSEWWAARAVLARLKGNVIDASLLCVDPFREARQ